MKKKFLDSIEVKLPCNESWDEMIGNNEVRFCSHCAKNVHNLSAMTHQNAEKLVKDSNGKLCVRYVKNPQGKLITAPPMLTKITRRATIAASVLATSLTLSTLAYAQGEPNVKKDNTTQTQKDKSAKDEIKQGLVTISGTVMDALNAVVPKAKVTLRETKTNKEYLTQTNDLGVYEFKNIKSSDYRIEFESPGFKKAVVQIAKFLNEPSLKLDVILEIGQFTMGVVAVEELPPVKMENFILLEKNIESMKLLELPKNSIEKSEKAKKLRKRRKIN